MEAAGKPFLLYHIQRIEKTGLPIIIATTDNDSEKPIVDFCESRNLKYYKGDENDVLSRYNEAAKKFNISTIIRVTSDCPLIDPEIILKGLAEYQKQPKNTYYSNTLERTYPRGMDYEIFSYDLLQESFENATKQQDREHVTPYIWRNSSGNVNIINDLQPDDSSKYRITLDTREDQELITKLIEEYNADELDCSGIIEILKNYPYLADINKLVEQKKIE